MDMFLFVSWVLTFFLPYNNKLHTPRISITKGDVLCCS